ncbi:hypothetical protein J2N86_16145 (plasmid) [Legionella lytica]|uniref:Ankyrin repeats (3 copies) n=1 Tax=Legionella lytica TaxID=96232 RepID=A0ABY4YD42_9GAMM|nr:hypothetical protein [Legionella lytica]USQ15552.1 hypothetical protein J2N86_16145 [Legionella lytica]
MSLETELFKLLNKREYATVLTLLKQNPNIDVNALNEEGGSFLMEAVMNRTKESPERYVFIEMLLSNPEFKHANKPYNEETATPAMFALKGGDPLLTELMLKYKDSHNMEVLFSRNKLMYEAQLHLISSLETSSSRLTLDSLPAHREVLAILLQMTVQEAIKQDDPSLLQRVVDAGAKLYYPLKDKTYPMDLVKDHPELKVHAWLSTYIKQQISTNPTFALAAHGLARKHQEREQELMEQLVEQTSNDIKSLFKFFDYKEPQSTTSEAPKPGTNGIKNPGQ